MAISSVNGLLKSFVNECVKVFGGCVRSIVLYGGLARGEFVPRVSDIDLVIILQDDCWHGVVDEATYPVPRWIVEKVLEIVDNIHRRHGLGEYVIDVRVTSTTVIKERLDPRINSLWLNSLLSCYVVLYGENVFKNFTPPPISRKDIVKALEEYLKTVKLISKAKRVGGKVLTLRDKAKACINNALLAVQAFLCLYDKFYPSKREAWNRFMEIFGFEKRFKDLPDLYGRLVRINELNVSELKESITKSVKLVELLAGELVKEI